MAHAAGDKQTVIDAYLDILDYDNESLSFSPISKVFDSLSYKE